MPHEPEGQHHPLALPDAGGFERLLSKALELRSQHRYALHPVEAVVQHFRAQADSPCQQGNGELRFEQAEAHYRAGAQGLRLSEIPQLPRQLRELSRLSTVDRVGRKALRQWAEESGLVMDEARFFQPWEAQGKRGGAEHQVYYDEQCGRWFKRLYHGVNHSTLGDYLIRMRLHGLLFPETAYCLEGFTLNAKSKACLRPPLRTQDAEPRRSPCSRIARRGLTVSAIGYLPRRVAQAGEQPLYRGGAAAGEPEASGATPTRTSPPPCKSCWRRRMTTGVTLYQANLRTYQLLRYGVPVQVAAGQAHEQVHLVDWEHPDKPTTSPSLRK
jgi:hypothetical protein